MTALTMDPTDRAANTAAGRCIEGCNEPQALDTLGYTSLWCQAHLDLLREGNRSAREARWESMPAAVQWAGYGAAVLEHNYGPTAAAAHTHYPVVGGL